MVFLCWQIGALFKLDFLSLIFPVPSLQVHIQTTWNWSSDTYYPMLSYANRVSVGSMSIASFPGYDTDDLSNSTIALQLVTDDSKIAYAGLDVLLCTFKSSEEGRNSLPTRFSKSGFVFPWICCWLKSNAPFRCLLPFFV